MDGWMVEWVDAQGGLMDACMHACMHGWMDGWVDGWMYM